MLHIPVESGKVSDGYHTFDELYEHRCILFLALAKQMPNLAWISKYHQDGTMFAGWFVMGINLPSGVITYHLPVSHRGLAVSIGCTDLELAPPFDGHTSSDVVKRLIKYIQEFPPTLT